MATSPLLKLTLQALGENEDNWGSILNDSALRLLEDAIAGTATVSFTGTTYTLNDDAGGPTTADGSRYMILAMGGSPGGAATLTVPTRSKVYLAVNNTGENVTVKTAAGTGAAIGDGSAQWVFCDGTNVQAAATGTAVNAELATLALDSDALGGTAAAGYAKLASPTVQSWSAGQAIARTALTVTGIGPYSLTPNMNDSNAFYHLTTQNFTLEAPQNPANGMQFSLIVEQGATPRVISYAANTFLFKDAALPTLTASANAVDYFGFEYVSLSDIGAGRWLGSQIKGFG